LVQRAWIETALGARLPIKEVFQQPLILDFGLIVAMQCNARQTIALSPFSFASSLLLYISFTKSLNGDTP
jgi:hypothetical protein